MLTSLIISRYFKQAHRQAVDTWKREVEAVIHNREKKTLHDMRVYKKKIFNSIIHILAQKDSPLLRGVLQHLS